MAISPKVNQFLLDLSTKPEYAADYAKIKAESTALATEITNFRANPFSTGTAGMEKHGAELAAVVNKFSATHPEAVQEFTTQAASLKQKLQTFQDVGPEVQDLQDISKPPVQDPAQLAAENARRQQEAAAAAANAQAEQDPMQMILAFICKIFPGLGAWLGIDNNQAVAGTTAAPAAPTTPAAPTATAPEQPAPTVAATLSPEAAAAAQAAAGGLAPVDGKAGKITVQAPAGVPQRG